MSPSPRSRLRDVARKAREAVATDAASDRAADASAPASTASTSTAPTSTAPTSTAPTSAEPGSAAPSGGTAVGPLESRLFDPWYYGLQVRGAADRTPQAALDHWVREGAAAGLLPNPLTDVEATGLDPARVVAAVLDGSARLFPVRAILDDIELVGLAPEAADHPGGPVGFYLQHAHAGAPVPALGRRSWKRFAHLKGQQSRAVETILGAGLLDRPYYEAQAGRTFVDDRAAVRHFLETGESDVLSPSPLYERSWYRSDAGVRMPMTLMHLLRTGGVKGAAGPHFDGATYLERVPEAAEHPGGPLGHFVAHADAATMTVPAPDSGVEPAPWGAFRQHMLATAQEIGAQQALLRPLPTTSARWVVEAAEPAGAGAGSEAVAIVSDGREWGRELPESFSGILGQRHGTWTLRVAVDAGAPVPAALLEAADDPRVVLVPTAETSWAGRTRAALADADEPWTASWQPQETWEPYLLDGLLASAEPGALVHAAAVDEATGRTWSELAPSTGLLWDVPRPLSAVLLPTSLLKESAPRGPRAEAGDRFGWDLLLRHDLAPRFVPFVGVRGEHLGERPLPAGHRSTFEHVVRAADVVDWADVEAGVTARVPGRVSVLLVMDSDRHRVRRAVDDVLEHGADHADLEVVVVDNGSDREVAAILTACYAGDPRVHVDRLPGASHLSVAVDRALAASTGDLVVLLDRDTEVADGWLPPLVEAMADSGVVAAQPVVLTADRAVRTAGFTSVGTHVVPVHLWADHPVDDLPDTDLAPDAVSGECLVMRADALVAVRGLDPAFVDLADVDLSLRLLEARGGRLATVVASRVSRRSRQALAQPAEADQLMLLQRWGGRLPAARADRWASAGLELAGLLPADGLPASRRRTGLVPLLRRTPQVVADGPGAGLPRLRWAVKIAARGGASGDAWGDSYFAADVVRGLREWGQEAFVDRRGAHERPGVDHLDDVTLTLRGLWPAVAQPGATNVLWVISHPDAVPVDELAQGFDLVYSAGPAWAEQMRAGSGVDVRTLLQATDTSRFRPDGDRMDGVGALFVGRTRKVMRPIVHDALAVGADLTIYGDGWEEFIDPAPVAADHLANDRVPAAYRGARVVLNDHWPDMARLGFYSNRLFDAVASGARVVSDPVDGLDDVLGSSVRTYRTQDELRALLDPASTDWPGADELLANAARVAAEHSFAARAKVLLADVLDARGVAHDLNG